MRVYGMSYRDAMGMPMRAFWFVSGMTARLLTAEGIDHLEISMSAQSGEAAANALERMQAAAPNPVKLTGEALAKASAVRDEEGFNQLRGLSG